MHISLRAGERIYVNGAVLRVDRKVTMELLNDVAFLLENHVLHAEQATTPLRQIYFIVQTMLIEPPKAAEARQMFEQLYALLCTSFENAAVLAGLERVHECVSAGKLFEALKTIRVLFPIEDEILARSPRPSPAAGDQLAEAISCK
jgi:flagellar protein FlbT